MLLLSRTTSSPCMRATSAETSSKEASTEKTGLTLPQLAVPIREAKRLEWIPRILLLAATFLPSLVIITKSSSSFISDMTMLMRTPECWGKRIVEVILERSWDWIWPCWRFLKLILILQLSLSPLIASKWIENWLNVFKKSKLTFSDSEFSNAKMQICVRVDMQEMERKRFYDSWRAIERNWIELGPPLQRSSNPAFHLWLRQRETLPSAGIAIKT